MQVINLVHWASDNGCSDLHLTSGEMPVFRKNGRLIKPIEFIVSPEMILELAPTKPSSGQWQDLDFAADMAGRRLRVNIYRHSGKPVCAIRLLNDKIPTLEELFLPPVLQKVADEPNGLVLITGPTGSGKSTTLAAMIDYIARTRSCHIITIEDPIEYVYSRNTGALIHQRELGPDVRSFADALRGALREDPDVILVGEMRDYETISAAVTAAETGHLVLSTLHTTGAARTVDRIIDVFPSEARGQIRTQLAGMLRAVMTQSLLPLADDSGRVAATEVMIGTDAVLSLIRESKTHQLNTIIQSGAREGMHTLESCLADYVRKGIITKETAEKATINPSELRQLLGFA